MGIFDYEYISYFWIDTDITTPNLTEIKISESIVSLKKNERKNNAITWNKNERRLQKIWDFMWEYRTLFSLSYTTYILMEYRVLGYDGIKQSLKIDILIMYDLKPW